MSGRPVFSVGANLKSIKSQFLDRPAITSSLDKASRKRLNRFGATTRQIARRSMRKGGQPLKQRSKWPDELRHLAGDTPTDRLDISPMPRLASRRGEPPRYRSRGLRDRIFYVLPPSHQSVLIGPQLYATGDAETLEYGGPAKTRARKWVAWWENGRRKIRLVNGGGRRVKIDARPFMAPAYNTALDRLVPGIWKDSLR